ncbi:MAG TPA: NADPH-dependent assimilatory sulfite reductase hemoprotein subunit [Opitutaceae bacterium]|jgi:sulfite reductase (NADPH) hemoprotein beta-component|nr:NADPH-dependent assimilatory sulfite reductase hemoprotein subunit [Opitutaceae bacterium]
MSTTPTEPTAQPLHKNEQLKADSNYLRGRVRADLEDTSSGTVPDDSNQLMKFHGVYSQDDRDLRAQRRKEGKEKAFIFMARVRVPAGICTTRQWQALDGLADSHGNGTLKITNRQSFQFHGVIKSRLRPAIREINRVLLDTIAACGDVNRNVMCSPDPDQADLHAQVQTLARTVSDAFLPRSRAYHEIFLEDELVAGGEPTEEPIYGKTYLPRKFKIVFAIPPRNDVDVFAHDLGFVAIADEQGRLAGFDVLVGGGMGMTHGQVETYPRAADVMAFCTPDQVLAVATAVITTQRDFGDRTDRKHARLKYTIADRGLVWFREEVERRIGYRLSAPRRFEFTHTADRFGWNPAAGGRFNYTLFIENGRVQDTPDYPMKTGLREIARVHRGDFRLTPNQHLIIADVAPEDRAAIDAVLAAHKLDTANHASVLRLHSMACVALPTCGLALAESERYLPELITALEAEVEAAGLRNDAIIVRMTGCPNGCGRPYLAEIGMVGKAPGKYNVYLGAAFNGSRLNELYKSSVPAAELVPLLRPLLRQYATERRPGEHFGDFVVRIGLVTPTGAPQDFHEVKGAAGL